MIITSVSATNTGLGTIIQSVDDVILANLTLQDTIPTYGTGTSSDDSAYAPQGVYPNTKIVNCIFASPSVGGLFMRLGVEYAGTYINCVGTDYDTFSVMFQKATGTFRNCSTNLNGFGYLDDATGTFTDCSCVSGFGYGDGIIVSGTFTNCKAVQESFGFNVAGTTTVTGKFYRCTADSTSFGDSSSTAYFEDCTVTALGFGPPSFAATMSGTYVRCRGGVGSFGVINGSVLDGTFIQCQGGASSFGSGTSCVLSGDFIDCIGANKCFGQNSSLLSGTFIRCQADNESFGFGSSSLTPSTITGKFYYCKGNDDCFGRNSSIESSALFEYCTGRDRCFCQGNVAGFGSGCSGTFKYCTGRDACFGAGVGVGKPQEGTFDHCTARDGSFAAGAGAEADGNYYHCIARDTSFGAAIDSGLGEDPIASGLFIGCVGENSCFGSTSGSGDCQATGTFTDCAAGSQSFGGVPASASGVSTFSGTATNCSALENSFGSSEGGLGVNSGSMINCQMTTTTWASPFTGRMDGCVITASVGEPMTVGAGAFVFGTTLIGPTTENAVSGSGNVSIGHCRGVASGIVGPTNLIGTPYNIFDDDVV